MRRSCRGPTCRIGSCARCVLVGLSDLSTGLGIAPVAPSSGPVLGTVGGLQRAVPDRAGGWLDSVHWAVHPTPGTVLSARSVQATVAAPPTAPTASFGRLDREGGGQGLARVHLRTPTRPWPVHFPLPPGCALTPHPHAPMLCTHRSTSSRGRRSRTRSRTSGSPTRVRPCMLCTRTHTHPYAPVLCAFIVFSGRLPREGGGQGRARVHPARAQPHAHGSALPPCCASTRAHAVHACC
jgi:hypothetical protein